MYPAGSKAAPKSATEAFWLEHLERYGESGLSVREYCERHRLATASLYYWRRRFESRERNPALLAERLVEVTGLVSPRPAWEMEISLAGGATVRLAPGASAAALARVIEVLASC